MMGNIICEYIRELVNEDLDKIPLSQMVGTQAVF